MQGIDLAKIDVVTGDFSSADFSGMDLRTSGLQNNTGNFAFTRFRNADISGLNFGTKGFNQGDLTGANATGASFNGSMQNVQFVGANLTNVTLGSGIDFYMANFQGATVTGVTSSVPVGNWKFARCPDGTVLPNPSTVGCFPLVV